MHDIFRELNQLISNADHTYTFIILFELNPECYGCHTTTERRGTGMGIGLEQQFRYIARMSEPNKISS